MFHLIMLFDEHCNLRAKSSFRNRTKRAAKMESLWMDGESAATLEEVLVFIDSSYDLPEDATDSDQSSRLAPSDAIDGNNLSGPKTGSQDQLHRSCTRLRSAKKPKTRAENHKAVVQYRKRNREEILELRGKLEQMETQLAQLQTNRNCALVLDDPRRSQYSKMADTGARKASGTSLEVSVRLATTNCTRPEFRKLQQSIELNQKLKASLAEYLSKTPDALLKKPITKHDLNLLFGIEDFRWKITHLDSSMDSDLHSVLFTELHHHLENVYMSTTAIPRPVALHEHSENVFATRDPIRGHTFEMTSRTRVNCHTRQLVDHVWSHLSATDSHGHLFVMARPRRFEIADRVTQFNLHVHFFFQLPRQQVARRRAVARNMSMALNSPQFGEIPIRGVSSVRRFDEPERSVIVFTSRLVIPEAGLIFREEGWMVMSNLSSGSDCWSSPPSTLLQIYYRVFGETSAAVRAAMPEKSAQLHEFVLDALFQRMRVHHLEVQNTLVQELDAIQTGEMLSSPVLTKCPV